MADDATDFPPTSTLRAMLTRIRVQGFKNLLDAEVYFGPFTCIAGGNAVGKSNLFDAIMFLSALADRSLIEAAMSVRDRDGRSGDILTLFHATRSGHAERIHIEADMIVPEKGIDDLGQDARASITFLRYALEIRYRGPTPDTLRPGLQITSEELTYIPLKEAPRFLPFKPSQKWQRSVVRGRRTSHFISTDNGESGRMVRLHQDGTQGRAKGFLASTLPRTVLSTVNAAESPTALLARREMQAWRLLQLEPSALRASDSFTAPTEMGSDGSHLASTLHYLGRLRRDAHAARTFDVNAYVGNRLSQLVGDVRSVALDRDDTRELLTIHVALRDGTKHPARSLSDGTLRFLALAVLEADPRVRGLLCLEEPENGVHPERIISMVNLLQDLTVDTSMPVTDANALRQVIVNTHSPVVVGQVPDDSLIFAEQENVVVRGERAWSVVFRPLFGTWRHRANLGVQPVQRGKVMSFLQPIKPDDDAQRMQRRFQRVYERDDMEQLKFWTDYGES